MVIFLLFSFTPVIQHAYAVNVNVDLEKLPDHARKAILDLEEKGGKKEPVTADIAKYETMGVALGKSLNALVKELGVTINEFIKTPVGKLSAAVLLWKLVFYELFILLLKLTVLFITGLAIGFSFMRFHVPQKMVIRDPEDKSKKDIQWIQKYKWKAEDAKVISCGIHLLLVAILILILFISL
jgi:hypothetical protein